MITRGRDSTGYGYRGAYNPNRQQQSFRRRRGPVDETINPKSDLTVVDEAVLMLRIHIPGFVKEELKINIDDSLSYISVKGEKKRIDNSLLRFTTFHAIPGDYNLSQATTELDRGILTIRIPKHKTDVVDAKTGPIESEASTSRKIPAGSEQSRTVKPEMPKIKEGTLPTLTTPGSALDGETHRKDAGVKISPQKGESEAITLKGQDGAPLKAGELADDSSGLEKKEVERDGGSVDQRAVEKKEMSQANWKPVGTEKPGEIAQQNLLKDGNGVKNKVSSMREGANLDNEGKEKKITDQRSVDPGRKENKSEGDFSDTKEKPGEDIISRTANSSITKSEKHHLAMTAKEQKELLINICAAVSVIVVLGGCIVHKFS